jgi:tRNA synthetase class II core domain (G, H, P, S and T)
VHKSTYESNADFKQCTMLLLLLKQCVQQIDLKIKDAIGRLWQCSTVQADFNLPDRFGMEYIASDGTKQQPVMLHRAIFGSVERFFGILVENTAGNFPLWLAPVQVCALYAYTLRRIDHASLDVLSECPTPVIEYKACAITILTQLPVVLVAKSMCHNQK